MMRRFRTYPQIGGKKGGIPSGWVEVEYVIGGISAYIDLGIVPEYGISARIVASAVDGAIYHMLFGSTNDTSKAITINCGFGSNAANVRYGSAVKSVRPHLENDVKYNFTIDENHVEIGGTVASWSDVGHFKGEHNMLLFRANGSTSVCNWRIYGADVSLSGIDKLSLVGVRNATTNEVAMCDILTGDIYRNAGTGTFVAGPDKKLPYDAECEYIEGDGVAYIDTGFVNDQLPIGFDCTFSSSLSTSFLILSVHDSSAYYGIRLFGNAGSNQWVTVSYRGNNYQSSVSSYLSANRFKVDRTNGEVFRNGESVAVITPRDVSRYRSKILILANSFTSINASASAGSRVHHINVNRDDFELDLIPVRITNENGEREGALYDKIGKTLFRNANPNGGAFIIGPDK